MYNLQYYTSKATLKIIYHNLIESNILYGLQIWGTASTSNIIPLQGIVDGIIKLLTPKRLRNSTSDIHDTFNTLTIQQLFQYQFIIKNYFSEKVCMYEWERMEKRGKTIGTLHHYARTDDKESYKKFIEKEVHWVII